MKFADILDERMWDTFFLRKYLNLIEISMK